MREDIVRKIAIIIFHLIFVKLNSQCPNSVQLGSASNMFGVISNANTPVAVDNSINTVAFLQILSRIGFNVFSIQKFKEAEFFTRTDLSFKTPN